MLSQNALLGPLQGNVHISHAFSKSRERRPTETFSHELTDTFFIWKLTEHKQNRYKNEIARPAGGEYVGNW